MCVCSREEGLCGCAEGGPVGSEEQSGRVWVWTGGTGKEPTEAARVSGDGGQQVASSCLLPPGRGLGARPCPLGEGGRAGGRGGHVP